MILFYSEEKQSGVLTVLFAEASKPRNEDSNVNIIVIITLIIIMIKIIILIIIMITLIIMVQKFAGDWIKRLCGARDEGETSKMKKKNKYT